MGIDSILENLIYEHETHQRSLSIAETNDIKVGGFYISLAH